MTRRHSGSHVIAWTAITISSYIGFLRAYTRRRGIAVPRFDFIFFFWELGEVISLLDMKIKFVFLLWVFLFGIVPASAQGGRSYIKQAINEWGTCRNVAITLTGGDLALNWNNAYASSGIPRSLSEALEELNENKEFIDDVQLTESGRWLILYGNNGFAWNDIPYSLEQKIREYNNDNEVITSVTFNDAGAWIVISQEYISASSPAVYEWIEEGIEKYGQLWAAHMTEDGLVLCYEGGYKFLGNVPENLKQKLRECKIDVFRIKFLSDGTYFIADKNGYYSYYM